MKKTIHLQGIPFGLAKAMHDEAKDYMKRLDALQTEYAAISEELQGVLGRHWRRLFISLGRPNADRENFQLDASYLPHGFLFLVEEVGDAPPPLPGEQPGEDDPKPPPEPERSH